jgi:hypothetical protein
VTKKMVRKERAKKGRAKKKRKKNGWQWHHREGMPEVR